MNAGDARVEGLRSVPWLASLPPAALAALAEASVLEVLDAGAVLYREGDPSHDLAVVVTGRLRAQREAAGAPVVDREVGAGEPVGELGALTDEPRAATVVAVRDTQVVRVPIAALDVVLAAAPEVARTLTGVVAERLRHPVRRDPGARTVALLALDDLVDLDGLADDLAAAIVRCGAPAVRPGNDEADDASMLAALIAGVERDGGVAVLPLDGRSPEWNRTCGRVADLVLLVGRGPAEPDVPAPVAALLDRLLADGVASRRELVLLHPPATTQPRGTARWLDAVEVSRHHHVRQGQLAHLDRIARHVLGRSVGLVLSGGGARAMAHLGARRALAEAGVPVDLVGGSSIGGVLGAQLAMEPDLDEVVDLDRRLFRKASFGDVRRLTVPLVSLLSIRSALPLFEAIFGDTDLADTWIPCFVTTVDFTDCELRVHDRGPAATWARATASPPGLWPAVVDADGHLHVDGGVLDNVPVLPMRRRGAGTVLVVNVAARRDLAVAPGAGEVSSWTAWLRRRAGRGGSYPTVASMLLRLGLVTSLPAQVEALADADVVASPDLDRYGMGAYRTFEPMVEAGHTTMQRALAGRPDGWWAGRPFVATEDHGSDPAADRNP